MHSKICKAYFLLPDTSCLQPLGMLLDHLQQDEPMKAAESEAFNPGDFIFDHIKDAHEWHLLTIGHTHISIPLPVILYQQKQGP